MPIRNTLLIVGLFFPLLGIFMAFPHLDITVSSWFFGEQGFYLARHPVLLFIDHGIPWLTRILVVTYILLLIGWAVFRQHPAWLPPIVTLYLLVALALGPGLLVSWSKDYFGRARPDDITTFGGSKHFSEPFIRSDQCEKNCSFLSGHSGAGFYFMVFSLVVRRYRKTTFAAGLLFGSIVAFSRVLMGKHFLSDVVFSGYFVYLTLFLLYYYLFRLQQKIATAHSG